MTVPKRLRHIVGKREIKKSLRTTDKTVAIPAAMNLYSQVKDYFHQIELAMSNKKPKIQPETDSNLFSEKITLSLPGGGEAVIDTGDPVKDAEVAQAMLQATGSAPAPAPAAPAAPAAPVSESIKLSEAAQRFCDEKVLGCTWTAKTRGEMESVFDLLRRVLGNKVMDAFTFADGRRFKETLLRLPPNHTKGVYSGKTIKQILAMSPAKTMAPRTVNDKIIRSGALFQWAIRQGYCSIDPFGGLKISIKSRPHEDRDPFTNDDIKLMLGPVGQKLFKHEWQRWLVLLGIFTGCRLQEIAQLRLCDIDQADGVPVIKITPDAGPLKTAASERIVPIHPFLSEYGVGIEANYRESLGEKLFFPELQGRSISSGEVAGRWFNRTFLQGIGLRPTKKKISFHSFRHTFAETLKVRGVDEGTVGALMGHSHSKVTFGVYGTGKTPLERLQEAIEKLTFPV